MVVTVLKCTYIKQKPREITYRDYKKFDQNKFKEQLRRSLADNKISAYFDFERIFLQILDTHAPFKKKIVSANQAPFVTKTLRKAIMRRSEFESNYHKNPTKENNTSCRKQKNYCSRLYKKERKKYYANLNLNDITDSKKFWRTIKPLFSDKGQQTKQITLIDKGNIISDDHEVADTFSSMFNNAVNSLNIEENKHLLTFSEALDPVDKAIKVYEAHPSILKIKEINKPQNFSFSEVNLSEIEKQLQNLNPKKATTYMNMPTKLLKILMCVHQHYTRFLMRPYEAQLSRIN